MSIVNDLKAKILSGDKLTKADALALYDAPLDALCAAADDIRSSICGNGFDLCTIINGKSGRCTEDCRFCAQSAHHPTAVTSYPLLDKETILADAHRQATQGVLRYSIVTAGRQLSTDEVDAMCDVVRAIRAETSLAVCVSFGLLDEAAFRKLAAAGVTRVHNNLETSRRFFPQICTSHRFADKCRAIRAAQAAGLAVCSGGIMGLGETPEDRVDLAFSLRDLGVVSVPINMLNPIPGTPFADRPLLTSDELRRIVAVFRFILPEAAIRLAGGRGLLADKGAACFSAGANAAISGDMLTTAGISVATDRSMVNDMGFEVRYDHE